MVKQQSETMGIKVQPAQENIMEVDITSETSHFDKQELHINGVSIGKNGAASNCEVFLNNQCSSSLDANQFLSTCKDTLTANLKGDMSTILQDIELSFHNASSIVDETEVATKRIFNLISNSNNLFKNHIQNSSNVKTYCTLINNAHSKPVLNSIARREPITTDGLEILSTVTAEAKVNLPPVGELTRSELDVGSRVWVMKTNLLNVWVKGRITNIRSNGSEKCFNVRLDNQKVMGQKLYKPKELAYENTATVIVPVGTRIIARYTDSAGRSAHYAGIIAEPPKVINFKRYLIFFDDGCAQYVKHEDIHVVYTQSVDVADDVHQNMSEFIRGYLLQYPERPMLKLQIGQYVKAEFDFDWSDTKVLEIDCSLAKILFKNPRRTEWIYRGSTRLKPLCNELANAEAHRLEGKNRRRHNLPRKPHQPYVEYTREEDVVVIDSDSDDDGNKCVIINKPRNTARKSLAARPLNAVHIRGNPVFRVTDKKSHLGFKEIANFKSFARVQFRNHDCGFHCREKDDLVKHKGKNPLVIPIFLGWERQLRKFRSCGPGPKQVVVYRSPCGRHLRDLFELQDYLYLVKSRMTIDMFSFNISVVIFRSFRPKEVFYNDDDITLGRENMPISCVNSLGSEPPPYVEYSATRFPGEGVFLNLDQDFLCGCDCTDNCQNPATCACQQLTNYAKYGTPFGDAGYKFRRLREPLVTGVYECNNQCKCNSQCGNRVVQNGITVRLQMFKTHYKGWGIRCLDDIDAGQFICIYAGQLLTEQGADADGKQCGDEYLAELDHIEVVEKAKDGYESDVPEFAFGFDEDVFRKIEVDKSSSDDQYASSDSDVLYADSDSEFESRLRSTATSTYATRSRRRKGQKSSNSSLDTNSNVVSEDSNSSLENSKKDIKGLPDLSTNLETCKINPRPVSPESAEMLDKIELKRKPKIYDDADMDTPMDSPQNIKTKSDEQPKSEKERVVAKKSVSMKNPLTSLKYEDTKCKFKSVRNYFGEDSVYIMDAKSKGNIGRYLNHSCEPNVFVQSVFVDTHDLRFPSVAFFAYDSIEAGTELTWDYNYEVGSVADKVMICYCEAPSCRGRLL